MLLQREMSTLIEQIGHLEKSSPRHFPQKSIIMFFFGMVFLKEIILWGGGIIFLVYLQLQKDSSLLHRF